MIQTEKILILKTFKHGEADLIVHGLNILGARVGFIAKGGLKSRKRFAGGLLEPSHYVEVTYKVNPAVDGEPLHTLREARLLRDFAGLRKDYHRLETALHMLRLVHRLGQHGVIDAAELFNLLGNALAAAETSHDLDKLKLHFEMKVLAAQGVLPHETEFKPWLAVPLSAHEGIEVGPGERRLVSAQVHDHLRAYIGTLV